MLLLKNGRIHVGNGEVREEYDILIDNNTIQKIGKNLDFKDINTIDATGKEIFPGFIDPLSSYGCIDTHSIKDQDEISNPITPGAKIKYAFNHNEIMDEELYKVGITAIGATPGNRNMIGGQMAVYKTWGKNSNKMLVKEPVALKGSVIDAVKDTYGKREVFPMTKMGVFTELENFLAEHKRNLNDKNLEIDDSKNIVKKVLERQIPLFITANSTSEINSLINIISKYDLDITICGGFQADRCMESIGKVRASIIVGEQTNLTAKNYNNTDLYKIYELQKQGGLVSFTLTGDYGLGGKVKYLWNAIEFHKAGVESEEVLKMMTMNPAKMLGVDNILGTIEEGKEADIVIYTKNPIEYYNSKVACTIIGGQIAYREGGNDKCY